MLAVYLSDVRDQVAAETFFRQCHQTTVVISTQLTTDKEPALSVVGKFPLKFKNSLEFGSSHLNSERKIQRLSSKRLSFDGTFH